MQNASFRIKGNDAFNKRKYDLALKHYSDGIKNETTNTDELGLLFGNRCQVYLKLSQPARAFRDALEQINYQPGSAKGYYRKGVALHCMLQLHEAKSALERAKNLIQDDSVDWYLEKVNQDIAELEAKKEKLRNGIYCSQEDSPEHCIFKKYDNFKTGPFLSSIIRQFELTKEDYNHWLSLEIGLLRSMSPELAPPEEVDIAKKLLDIIKKISTNNNISLNDAECLIFNSLIGGEFENAGVGLGCNASSYILMCFCIESFDDMDARGLMVDIVKQKARLFGTQIPSWALSWDINNVGRLVVYSETQPISDIHYFESFKDPVLYVFGVNIKEKDDENSVYHQLCLVQVPTSAGPRYRVIQSYGSIISLLFGHKSRYSLNQWLDGTVESVFQGWMNKAKAIQFAARLLCSVFSGQTWLIRSCFHLLFGCDMLENFNYHEKSKLYYRAIPFNMDTFNERLSQFN